MAKWRYKKFLANQARERAMENRKCPTPTEQRFMDLLKTLDVKYIFEFVHFYAKSKYRIIDFHLPDYKLNIELDGGYHDKTKSYDIRKDWGTLDRVVRYRNEEVYKPEFVENFKAVLIKREHDLYGRYGFKVRGFPGKN